MSQSRFSIVLVGVSALLHRPLVSRLRPADGERSPWVVFTSRVGRFDSGGRSAGWPSGSLLPIFGTRRFGVAAGRLAFGLIASEIAIWRVGLWAHRFGNSARRVGLRVHCFRFSARTDSEWLLGEFVLPPSVSEIVLGGLAFGLTASAFRHAPIRRLPLGGLAFGLTASAFRHAPFRSGRWASWPSGSLLPLFGMRRSAPPKRGPTEHNDTTTVSLQNTYPNMLTYHIVRRKHFKTGKLLYYPQLVTPVADDHMHIIERIEKKCTLASADVKAVVDALEVEIIDSLRQGRSVRLGDLGSFRPTLRCSAGVGLPELAGVGQIKRVHVVFHPSSRIRRALSVKDHAVSFVQRDKKKHGANVQQGGSPTGGGTPGAPAPSTGSSAAGSAVTPPGTPVPAPPSTGTPAGTPVPAAPSTTTSTPTGTPAAGSGTSAAGSAVTPPGTPVPAAPSTGTPAGTPVPAAPSTTTSTPTGTPAAGSGTSAAGSAVTPAGTPVPAAPSTGTPAAGGA